MSKEQFMIPDEPYFTSEQVDEQIEHLFQQGTPYAQTNEAELVEALQRSYRVPLMAEDRAALAHARQRILHSADVLEHELQHVAGSEMRSSVRPIRSHRARLTRVLSGVAAVLIAGILLGSWLVVTHMATTSTASNTGRPEDIYSIHQGIAYRIDGSTGKVIWQHSVASRNSDGPLLQVVNSVVYTLVESDIYALDAKSGKQLWYVSNQVTTRYIWFVVDKGRVYISSSEENPKNTFKGALSAFDAVSGRELWHTTAIPAQVAYMMSAYNGNLYAYNVGDGDKKLYVMDGATGKLRWSYPLVLDSATHDALMQQGFPNSLIVENGVVYFSMGKVVYAVKEQSGQKIWEKTIPEMTYVSSLHLIDGVLYASEGYPGDDPGTYALATPNGQTLWISGAGFNMFDLPITNGLLLGWSRSAGTYAIEGADVHTGKVVWRVPFPCKGVAVGSLSPDCSAQWTKIIDGKLYLLESDMLPRADGRGDQVVANSIKSYDPNTGQLLTVHQLSGQPYPVNVLGVNNGLLYTTVHVPGKTDSLVYNDIIFVAYHFNDGTEAWRHVMPQFSDIFTDLTMFDEVLAP